MSGDRLDAMTRVMHDLNTDKGGCDHTMPDRHPPERPGYERTCLLDAMYVLENGTDPLDAAWAEAESELPDGWALDKIERQWTFGEIVPHVGAPAVWLDEWHAMATADPSNRHNASAVGIGRTLAAALRALAANLRERQP